MLFGRLLMYNNNLKDNGENKTLLKTASVDAMLEVISHIISSVHK